VTSFTRATLDRDLHALQDDILRLGGMLEAAISRAMDCLARRDLQLARQIVADDARLNALRFHVEEACVNLIATQQPAASDLRAVVATIITVSELERMGDYAAGIAKTVLKMGDEPLLKPLLDLPRMADECRAMMRRALDAYVTRDAEAARVVAAQDDVIDGLYNQIFRELMTYIVEDPQTISRALYLLFAAHNFERIGDRAVNICERVIFMASGELKELNAGPDAPL
jgi:phosphate transport system protein